MTDHGCSYSLALLGLDGWSKSVSSQVVVPIRIGIYLLASVVLGGNSLCYQYLKAFYCYLNMILYPDNDVFWVWLTKVREKREELQYFLSTEEKVSYFHEGTILF